MGKNRLFQKPVVSKFGLFYIRFWLICQKFGLFLKRLVLKQQVFPRIDIPTLDSINSVWWGWGGFVYGRVTILAVYYLGNNSIIFQKSFIFAIPSISSEIPSILSEIPNMFSKTQVFVCQENKSPR